ncbi:MAG: hypothetical protein IJ358_03655, partial [Clostridia bacterium]|nr:hypothetical protein [Clostridia bacterium]
AITRARKDLYLTSSSSRFMYGKRDAAVKSRFLREIDMVKDQAFGYGGYYGDDYSSAYNGYKSAKKEYDNYNSDYGNYSSGKYSNNSYGGGYTNAYASNGYKSQSTNTYSSVSTKGGLNIAGLSKATDIGKKTIDTSKVKVGARVNHIKFGAGVIVDVSSYASNKCVTIDFGVIGKKALSLDYAPITFCND